MSVDRFVAIHCPLKSLKFCTIRNANKMISSVFVMAVLYSLPRFLEYHTNVHKLELLNHINNETLHYEEIVTAETTEMGRSHLFRNIVNNMLNKLFQAHI